VKADFLLSGLLAVLSVGAGSEVTAQANDTKPVETCSAWIQGRPWAEHASDPRTRILSDHAACYDGMIERESDSIEELHGWLNGIDAQGEATATLVVRSGGGDAHIGLDLAEELQAKNVRVYLMGICASSCANFLYAGVRDRHVLDGTLVLFHGGFSVETRTRSMASLDKLLAGPRGALIKDHDEVRRTAREAFDATMARQDALYHNIGVNPAIVHAVDAMDFTGIIDRNCGGASDLPRDFVYFNLAQMERLGVAPVSGQPETNPKRVNERIATLGRSFVACVVPEQVLQTENSKAQSRRPRSSIHIQNSH